MTHVLTLFYTPTSSLMQVFPSLFLPQMETSHDDKYYMEIDYPVRHQQS